MRVEAQDIRRGLSDPRQLCAAVGLMKSSKRQANGLLVCCPVHGERNASCSVTRGPDGTVRVRCFSCDFTGDALSLVAAVHGLDTRSDFVEVLATGAELAGMRGAAEELRSGRNDPTRPRERPPAPDPGPPPVEYPPADEVSDLWHSSGLVGDDPDACRMLVQRRIDPTAVDELRLGRSLLHAGSLPGWAAYRRQTWRQTGHRLILRVFDARGRYRSVRAWRVAENQTPKRLPPAGHKASGLVLANRLAVGMLLGKSAPELLTIVEGEPDFLTLATRCDDAVIGIGSGAWNQEFAARVPPTTEVCIWTHHDRAGDRYADQVAETLRERCRVWRAV